jgi:hypothetical protein
MYPPPIQQQQQQQRLTAMHQPSPNKMINPQFNQLQTGTAPYQPSQTTPQSLMNEQSSATSPVAAGPP